MAETSLIVQQDDIIGLLYASVQDLAALDQAMACINQHLAGATAYYTYIDCRYGMQIVNHKVSNRDYQEAEAVYAAHYFKIDERLQPILATCAGLWVYDYEHYDARHRQRSEFYSDFMQRFGMGEIAACRFSNDPLALEGMSIVRPAGMAAFDQSERQFLQRLAGHMVRAATLRKRLQGAEQANAVRDSALAQLGDGVIWLDTALQVVDANPTAQRMLLTGHALRISQGALRAQDARDQQRLNRALLEARRQPNPQGCWLALGASGAPLIVSVIPAVSQHSVSSLARDCQILLLLRDPSRHAVHGVEQWRRAFDLTVAEARLAMALVDNHTPQSHADANCISINTVRTHLARLFAKTGTRRQSELVRLLLISTGISC